VSSSTTRTFSMTEQVSRALLLTRLFIESLNARDVQGLASLVSNDVEFRNQAGGRSLRGRSAAERLIAAAKEAELHLVRQEGEEVALGDHEHVVRVVVPVLEIIRGSEMRGTLSFEVRHGRISCFSASSEALEAARR
jgi:hypothetical protein